jgi:hypothetical protein
MKELFPSTLVLVICLSRLWIVVPAGTLESLGKVQSQREHIIQPPKSMKEEPPAALREEPINSCSNAEGSSDVKTPLYNQHTFSDRKAARGPEQPIVAAHNSGLKGATKSIMVSGIPGGGRTERPTSIEFAVAAIEGGEPAYQKAIFVKSNRQGEYTVALPPGT